MNKKELAKAKKLEELINQCDNMIEVTKNNLIHSSSIDTTIFLNNFRDTLKIDDYFKKDLTELFHFFYKEEKRKLEKELEDI